MRTVFISYRTLDAAAARALADCIASVGANVYLDERDPSLDSITVGAVEQRLPAMRSIRAGLQAADSLVALISRVARGSWWVPAELALALEMNKEVVAICETDVRPPDFQIHHTIRDEAQLRAWLSGLGSGPLDYASFLQFSKTLFKPAFNGLLRASKDALTKIEALWSPITWKGLVLEDPRYAHRNNWIGCRTETLTSTLHAIVAPVYLYKHDVRLDRSELEREVASILYDSWTDEESLARIAPSLLYEARKCTGWRTLRDEDPARYWLQGMQPKDIPGLFEEMTNSDGQLVSEEDFHRRYLDRSFSKGLAQKPLGLAANALQGFALTNRPVFARVMAVHLRVHHALVRLDASGGVGLTSLEQLFDLPVSSAVRGTDAEAASLTYITKRTGARLRPFLWEETRTKLVTASQI
jgi:hypothetical protein